MQAFELRLKMVITSFFFLSFFFLCLDVLMFTAPFHCCVTQQIVPPSVERRARRGRGRSRARAARGARTMVMGCCVRVCVCRARGHTGAALYQAGPRSDLYGNLLNVKVLYIPFCHRMQGCNCSSGRWVHVAVVACIELVVM